MDNFTKDRLLMFSIFIPSLISLLITVVLFANLATYVDKHGASISAITGGDFWLYMYWIRLLFLIIITSMSGYMLKNNTLPRSEQKSECIKCLSVLPPRSGVDCRL